MARVIKYEVWVECYKYNKHYKDYQIPFCFLYESNKYSDVKNYIDNIHTIKDIRYTPTKDFDYVKLTIDKLSINKQGEIQRKQKRYYKKIDKEK